MKIYDDVQGSPGWHAARLGIWTASQCSQVITPKRRDLSVQRWEYMHRLCAERATGESAEDFQGTYWTERGHEFEAEALACFAMETNLQARAVGFCRSEMLPVGCSPDWWGDEFGVEVKCPAAHTHIGYLLDGKVPEQYQPQIQMSMWVCAVPTWWFMSYHPDLPPLIRKVESDPEWRAALDQHGAQFLSELAEMWASLEAMGVTQYEN